MPGKDVSRMSLRQLKKYQHDLEKKIDNVGAKKRSYERTHSQRGNPNSHMYAACEVAALENKLGSVKRLLKQKNNRIFGVGRTY